MVIILDTGGVSLNSRQHKKIMCSLVAKLVAQIKYPELKLSSTRTERRMFNNEKSKVKLLTKETLKESDGIY